MVTTFSISCKKERLNLAVEEIHSGTDQNLYSIFSLTDQNLFICGGGSGSGIVLKSVNGGGQWEILCDDFKKPLHSIIFLDPLKGFAGADSGFVYMTRDGGTTWELYMDYVGIPYQYRTPLHSVCFADSDHGFFAGGSNFGRGIIYSTQDGGNHWSTSGYEHELRCIRFNEQRICAMGYGALLTSENGKDFTLNPGNAAYYTGLFFWNQHAGIACSYDGGLYTTTDGGLTYSVIDRPNRAFTKREHYLCIDSRDERVISCGLAGITALSYNYGNSFESGYSFMDTRINAVKMLNDHRTIAVGSNGKIFLAEF